MPPVLALAPLVGSLAGAEILPGLAGLLGADLGGAGLLGSTLGSTLGTVGGALGGSAAGALADKKDPLLGGILGAVGGGIGGPDLAGGLNSAVSAGVDALSGAASVAPAAAGAATGAPTSLIPAAGVGSGAGAAAPSAVSGGAAAIAAPSSVSGSASGLDTALGSSFAPDIAGGAGSAEAGSSLTGAGSSLANAGAGGTASVAPSTAGGTTNTFDTLLNDPTWKNFGKFAGANKDLITGGIGLAGNALAGNQTSPEESALRHQAKLLTGQANSFMRGELTPGMQAGLRGATESAKAALRSMFAQRGMSGSSSEVEALASVDQTAQVKGAEIAQSLIQQGVQESGLASQLWQTLLAESMRKDEQLGSAIGGFASALAGGSGSVH